MSFVKKVRNGKIYYYLAKKVRTEDGWKEQIIRPATEEEIEAYLAAKNHMKDMSIVVCSNPECDNIIKIPRAQKRKFYTAHVNRYKRFTTIYCSKECQLTHNEQLKVFEKKC
jgi:hypothetical protein